MNPVDPDDASLVALELHRRWEVWHLFMSEVPDGYESDLL
jgi:hypothetical protein